MGNGLSSLDPQPAEPHRLPALGFRVQPEAERPRRIDAPEPDTVGREIGHAQPERVTVALAAGENVNEEAISFLNRLSDWLFVAARWIAREAGEREVLWQRDR